MSQSEKPHEPRSRWTTFLILGIALAVAVYLNWRSRGPGAEHWGSAGVVLYPGSHPQHCPA